MTAVDHAELKRLADELVQMLAPDQGESAHPAFGHAVRIQNAHAALLSEIEGLKAERAINFDRDGDKIILPKIFSAELIGRFMWGAAFEAARELAEGRPFKSFDQAFSECEPAQSLRTQAPDSWRADRCDVEEAIHAWLRAYMGPVTRGSMTPPVRDALVDAILALRPQTAESA